jgi:hypothetical protein
MKNGKQEEISLKGLDSFSKSFLLNGDSTKKAEVKVASGQKLSPDGLKKYEDELKRDFIRRAGGFSEDLVAFIMEQKQKRDLSPIETVFAVALSTINMREAYGGDAKSEDREARLSEFDSACYGAQEYYDANS